MQHLSFVNENAVLCAEFKKMNASPDLEKKSNTDSGWYRFWKQETTAFYEVMRIATDYFCRQLDKHKICRAGFEILDYGCGPGFLLDHFASNDVTLTGADINSFFIDEAKKKYPGILLFSITSDVNEVELVFQNVVQQKKFDLIILLSISQYFPDVKTFGKVIHMLSGYLKPTGKILIADVIDEETSSSRDALALLYQCMKQMKLLSFLKFMSYVLFSEYKKVSAKNALLKVSEQDIFEISHNTGLIVKKVNRLTMHPSRKNYILSK